MLLSLLLISLTAYSSYQEEHTYDSQLTAKSYQDTIVKQNVNLVFYKDGCPYCQAAIPRIKKAASDSLDTTFYVNVQTKEGKALVKQYHINHSSTLVTIRNGVATVLPYAYDKNNHITVDTNVITKAFQEKE